MASIMLVGLASYSGLSFVGRASAATAKIWTNSSGDNKFSTNANWSDNAAPQDGDIIKFDGTHTVSDSNRFNNDIVGLSLGGLIESSAVGATHNFIYFNTLNFADGAIITSDQSITVGSDYVTVEGSIILDGSNRPIQDTNPNAPQTPQDDTFFDDVVATNLTIIGTDNDYCGGGGSYTEYNWTTNGTLTIDTNSGYTLQTVSENIPTNIVINQGGFLDFMVGARSVAGESLTYPGDITFNTGGQNQARSCATNFLGSFANEDKLTLSGTINLNAGDVNFLTYGWNTRLTFTGTINGQGAALKPSPVATPNSGDDYNLGYAVNNSSTNNSLTPSGPIVNYLPEITGDDSAKDITLQQYLHLTLNGTRGDVGVGWHAALKGNATMNSLYSYGIVAPGNSPGKMTVVSSLVLGTSSTYEAEILNTDSYDQIVVGDSSITTGTPVAISTNSTLSVTLLDGFKINPGDKFTIIDNKTTTAVSGSFKDLPEGATFKVGENVFKITYTGGDGNDVVLLDTQVVKVPDTGFGINLSNPLFTLLVTAVAAFGTIFVANKLRSAGSFKR